jgi:hypothetical protein
MDLAVVDQFESLIDRIENQAMERNKQAGSGRSELVACVVLVAVKGGKLQVFETFYLSRSHA